MTERLNWIEWRMLTSCSETLSETSVYQWSLEVRIVRKIPSTSYALARQCWIWNYFCRLKKCVQPESRELFHLVRMLRDPERASRELWENCSKKAGKKSGYIQASNKVSRQSAKQRSGVKLRNLALYGKIQASGLTEFIPFTCTSAILGQSCFLLHLASGIPPAPLQSP